MTLKENITELFVCVSFDFFCCRYFLFVLPLTFFAANKFYGRRLGKELLS